MNTEGESGLLRAGRRRVDSPYLNTAQAAHYVRLSNRTLETLRTIGGGPAYRKHAGRICYHIDDLDAWSAAHRHHSTTEEKQQLELPLNGAARRGKRHADH